MVYGMFKIKILIKTYYNLFSEKKNRFLFYAITEHLIK